MEADILSKKHLTGYTLLVLCVHYLSENILKLFCINFLYLISCIIYRFIFDLNLLFLYFIHSSQALSHYVFLFKILLLHLVLGLEFCVI